MKINELFFNAPWNKNYDKINDIKAKMTLLNIKESSYTIRDEDLSVDVKCDVNITSNLKECPVKFNSIKGNFIWHFKNLESVNNLPVYVSGNMSIAGNNITSLEGLPTKEVGGTFTCSNNKLKNLKGCPPKVNGLICSTCQLESLEGSPHGISSSFICAYNNLKSLKSSTFYVNGGFDCSYNNLTSLKYSPLSRKIFYVGNPIKKEGEQLEIEFTNSEKILLFDKIIYKKQDSKYNNMKGEIVHISDSVPPLYQINFKISDNPSLIKDTKILKIPAEFIHKIPEENVVFEKGDQVYYVNKGEKFYAYIVTIHNDDLIYCQFSTKNGEKLYYFAYKTDLYLSKKSKEIKKEEVKVDRIYCNDRIKYKGNKETYYGWEGHVVSMSYVRNDETFSVELEKNGIKAYLHGINRDEIEKIHRDKKDPVQTSNKEEKSTDNKKKKKFKIGDKIIFVKPDEPEYNCRGKIVYVNDYQTNYDIEVINNSGKEVRRNWIDEKYIKKHIQTFEKGEKVIFDDNKDLVYYKKVGMIKHSSKTGKYKVLFREDDGKLVTLTDIDGENLIKLETQDLYLFDDIIYTKLDSKYYGCLGVIVSYNLDKVTSSGKVKDARVDIQIITDEDNKKIKIKGVRLCDIEKQPPKREFRSGDIIRYINADSPYEKLEGEVVKKLGKDKYEIVLKTQDNENITIRTISEYLKLLADSRESENLKYGQKIIYKKEDSKYNNKTGIFRGIRSDGKYEIELDTPYTKLYVDGVYLYPYEEEKKQTTDYTTTTGKKKKKKIEENKPPILVYNRRNVVRKAGRKPIPQADETITEQ